MRRRRWRAVVLWVGCSLCVLNVAALLLSSAIFTGNQAPSLFSLYVELVGIAITTLVVWRFVPKFPRGHCRRCGYNLTGLTEARCPECGQPFERMTRAGPPLVRGSSRPIR